MAIRVKSETQALKTVLLHRPGSELEQLVPTSLERLLFDDIPYLRGAQAEHDAFAELLRQNGVQVVYLADLTAQTLEQSEDLRKQFVQDFLQRSGIGSDSYREALTELLLALPAKEMVLKTMTGVRFDELPYRQSPSLMALRSDRNYFVLDPIPNLYFTRDPFAAVGPGVSLHRMFSVTRNRETIYSEYFLRYHPDFAGRVPFYYTPNEPFSLEGGDILNLSAQSIAVGISQRTMPEAVEQLAKNIFADECEIQVGYAIGMAEPVSVNIECFNTNKKSIEDIHEYVKNNFSFRPNDIINELGLLNPIFKATACFGHFGRNEFPWEQIKK